jgi:hypothetical protein
MGKLFCNSSFLCREHRQYRAEDIGGLGMNYSPGSEAPEDGVYEGLNIFGTSAGITERLGKGERLPLAPQGYTWRKVLWKVGCRP